jgi:hypothetical protein
MIDDNRAFGGLRIEREKQIIQRNLPQCHFVHHKFLMA